MGIEMTVKKTPYGYMENLIVNIHKRYKTRVGKKEKVSYKEFLRFKNAELIDDEHLLIMELLLKYRYLPSKDIITYLKKERNTNGIERIVELSIEKELTQKLNTLRTEKLIERITLSANIENTNSLYKTPYFYTLSSSGYENIYRHIRDNSIDKKELANEKADYKKKIKANELLKELVACSTSLQYSCFSDTLTDIELNKHITIKEKVLKVYGSMTFEYGTTGKEIILEPIRRSSSWETDIVNRFKVYRDIIKSGEKVFRYMNPWIIVVCEDILQIEEVYVLLRNRDILPEHIYFMIDEFICDHNLRERILIVTPNEKGITFKKGKVLFYQNK